MDDEIETETGRSSVSDPRRAFGLDGRVVVVTGGGRGLGRAMSVGLAEVGARVVMCGRTQVDLDATVDAITANDGEAIGVVADLGDVSSLGAVVDAAVERFGAVDVVVNNAVDPGLAFIEDLTPEQFDRIFAVNVKGPVFLCNAALPHLERSAHASIVNVLSVALWIGGPTMGLYRSTKEALWGFTKVMAKEWAAKGIRVNGLAPGPFETTADTRGDGREERVRDATLFKRIAAAEEIVPPLLFLASDASRFMTGSIVTIDGGVTP
jgi:NAD(P)-dependent dehydrogenase (short-subunit alcohol dehydrogenase family)